MCRIERRQESSNKNATIALPQGDKAKGHRQAKAKPWATNKKAVSDADGLMARDKGACGPTVITLS